MIILMLVNDVGTTCRSLFLVLIGYTETLIIYCLIAFAYYFILFFVNQSTGTTTEQTGFRR